MKKAIYSTSKKLNALSDYVNSQAPIWLKQFPNCIGVHLGNKKRKAKELRYYSIVFHVEKKQKEEVLRVDQIIPTHFVIKLGNEFKKIPTDVIETGKLNLLSGIQPGEGVFSLRLKPNRGTIGLFFENNVNDLYACSNMHVMGQDFLNDNQISFFKPKNQQIQPDIVLFDDEIQIDAYLEKAIFNGIDVAIARIDDPTKIENSIPENGVPVGIKIINSSNFKNLSIKKFGRISHETKGQITGFSGLIRTDISNVFLNNLIVAEIKTEKGDSGSPVFDDDLNLIGSVVGGFKGGASDKLTLIIPIAKIIDFAQMTPLIKRIR